LRPADLFGEAAVGPGPEVCRRFATERLVGGAATTLVVTVHEDRNPPLVLVGLPGMIGGFVGLRGEVAGALCPLPGQASPVLKGLVWPLLLRHLLEHPPGPGGALPAKATLAASIPLRGTGGQVGTLNVTPSGAAWYEGRTFAATVEEMGTTESPAAVERAGAILAMEERAQRLLEGRDRGAGIRLSGARDGFSVAVGNRRARVRYGE
jgi:sulfur carrier protein ThiS